MHPVTAHHNDITDFSVLNALGKILQGAAVTRHQSYSDLFDGAAFTGQGSVGRAGPAPTTAHQRYLDQAAGRGMDERNGYSGQGRGCGDTTGGFDEFAA